MPESQIFKGLQDRPWALMPAKIEEIYAFLDRRLAGEKLAIPESRVPAKNSNADEAAYQVIDGVAVLPVYGVIDKRMNMLSRFSGGTSTELLARDFRQALADPKVQAILLDVDSPGGSVDGPKDVADLIYQSREQKPVVAFANGLMASAAYWIGSAAQTIVAPATAEVGSIGVVAMHYDYSAWDEKAGIKRTAITAGKYKRIASDEKPLSKEGAAYIQDAVDTFYSLFLEAVGKNRGQTPEQVHAEMADGRIFIGKKALKAGLIDQIGNFNDALALARAKGGAMPKNMTKATLQAENLELFQALLAEGAAGVTLEALLAQQPDAAEKLRVEGETRERARVMEMLEYEGDPAITLAAIKDGKTFAEMVKVDRLAEKEGREKALSDLKNKATAPLGQSPGGGASGGGENFEAKVQQLMESQKLSRAKATIKAAQDFPQLHADYIARQNQAKK